MEKSEIAKQLSELLLKSVKDVIEKADTKTLNLSDGGKPTGVDKKLDTKPVDKLVDTKPTDSDDTKVPTLDEIVSAIVPKLAKELKLKADGDDGGTNNSKISKAIKETLKTLGYEPDELDIDLVLRKKKKGETVDADKEEIIFKSKAESAGESDDSDDEFYEPELTDIKQNLELNKQLSKLETADRKKALSLYIRNL